MAEMIEQRRYPRIESENAVGYVLYDDRKKKVDQGAGRTKNLSQTGVLLETGSVLKGSYIILVTIDLEGKKIKVRGRVVRSRYVENPGYYLTGIEFIGPKDEQLEAIKVFVKAYQHRKHQNDVSL